MQRRVLLPVLLAVCFAAGGIVGYSFSRPIQALLHRLRHPPAAESWIGRNLPSIPQWTSDGAQWSAPNGGAPAVLVFWSTGCDSCVAELPALDAIRAAFGASVALYGFPIQGDVDLAECVASRKGVHWQQLRGEPETPINALAVALGVRKVPSVWIVDGHGVIRAERLELAAQLLAGLEEVLGTR